MFALQRRGPSNRHRYTGLPTLHALAGHRSHPQRESFAFQWTPAAMDETKPSRAERIPAKFATSEPKTPQDLGGEEIKVICRRDSR